MKHFTLTSRALLGLALMGALSAAPTLTSRAQAQPTPELQTRLNDAGDRINDDDANDTANDNNGPRNWRDRNERGPSARNRGDRNDRGVDDRGDKGRDFGGRNGKNDEPGARNRGGRDFGGRDFGGRDFGGRDFGGRDFGGRDFGGRENLGHSSGGRGDNFGGRENAGRNRPGRGEALSPVAPPKFIGVVTKIKNDREFDVRIDNKTYNVYLSAPSAPIRVGQTVGLDGERIGNNDIRSATLLSSRRR